MENITSENTTIDFRFSETTETSRRGFYNWPKCRNVSLPPKPSYRPYDTATDVMWKTIPPLIVIFGVFGNILTILVLIRSTKKMKSTSLYLLILAVSDTMFLLNTPIRQWGRFVLKLDFRHLHNVVCKLSVYLTYSTYQFSTWILVAVTIERVISVLMPYRVHAKCNVRASRTVIVTLFLTIFALNSHLLYGVGHIYSGGTVDCKPTSKEYNHFLLKTWPWIHFAVAFLLPFFILLVSNGIIIKQLKVSHKERKRLSLKDRKQIRSDGHEKRTITIMLVLLSAIFFVSQTPTIYFLYAPYHLEKAASLQCELYLEHTTLMDTIWFWYALTSLLSYTNATLNFLMYVISGSRFRGEVQAFLCCKPPRSTEGAFDSRANTYKDSSRTSNIVTVSDTVPD